MSRYIDSMPQPLLDDLVQGQWLPIVGAGFSRNAEYLDGRTPADWGELGRALGKAMGEAGGDTPPIESISAYEQAFGRVALVDRVGELIRAHHAHPGPAHLAFASVAFRNVITTNFDFLLERAYERAGRGCLPIVDEAQLSAPNRSVGPRVIKMHGDLHHPSRLVLTEDDYDQFLLQFPLLATSISAMLIEHTGVLIGYSLDDADTRQLLALIRVRLGKLRRPLWTILFNAKPNIVSRFERRGVKVVNLKLRAQTRGEGFAQLFDELAAHWVASVPEHSESADDRVSADLQLPNSDGRLCYFAVPTRLIGWYRDNIFPLVEATGLVPVTARDVYSSPGSVGAKIDALVERAAGVVAEVSFDDVGSYEAKLALTTKGPGRTLIVAAEENSENSTHSSKLSRTLLREQLFVRRPALDGDPAEFVAAVGHWLSQIPRDQIESTSEPRRLLLSGEYGPALISAVSLLEVTLSRVLSGELSDPVRPNLRALLRNGRRIGLVESDAELEQLEQVITRRNEAVHRVKPVSAARAREGVELVLRLVDRANAW